MPPCFIYLYGQSSVCVIGATGKHNKHLPLFTGKGLPGQPNRASNSPVRSTLA